MKNQSVLMARVISRSIILIIFVFANFLFPVKASNKDFDVSILNHSKETDHFIIHYNDKDSSCIYDILSRLEEKYPKICFDLKYQPTAKFDIMVYPDLKTFHSAILHPEYPDWIVGYATDKVYMVSPLNPGPNYPYEGILIEAVYEFAHVVIFRIPKTGHIPEWLNEGIASYEAGRTYYKIDALWKNQAIPTFDDLETQLMTLGPKWSYSIVEFTVKTYGIQKLPLWIQNGGDIQKTFGISKEKFWKKWADSIPKI